MARNFYDLLGVPEDATTDEIEAAYRERVKQTHPDVSSDERASEKTKHIIRAKEVLTDDGERQRYDRLGHQRYLAQAEGGVDWPPTGSAGASRSGATTGPTRSPGDDSTTDRSSSSDGSVSETVSGSADGFAGGSSRESRDDGSGSTDRVGGTRAGATAPGPTGGGSRATSGQYVGTRANASTDAQRNPWESTQGYTISGDSSRISQPGRLLPTQESLLLIGVVTVFYPVLVFSSVHPFFPPIVNVIVGICTLLTVAYLLSLPEVALTVFGFWSMVTPLALVALPDVSLLSLVGALALLATWMPLGLSVLLLSLTRP
jgi:curved DNA-binding protein CbpA